MDAKVINGNIHTKLRRIFVHLQGVESTHSGLCKGFHNTEDRQKDK